MQMWSSRFDCQFSHSLDNQKTSWPLDMLSDKLDTASIMFFLLFMGNLFSVSSITYWGKHRKTDHRQRGITRFKWTEVKQGTVISIGLHVLFLEIKKIFTYSNKVKWDTWIPEHTLCELVLFLLWELPPVQTNISSCTFSAQPLFHLRNRER